MSLDVPEAGLTFAFSMVLGVGLVLAVVAVASVWARDFIIALVEARGVALGLVVRSVDAAAGLILLVLAAVQFLD